MSFHDQSFRDFAAQLAAKTPTPGGGSAAALAGGLGVALGLMAVEFTVGRKTTGDDLRAVLETIRKSLGGLQSDLFRLADEDTRAYEKVRQARKMPKETPEEQDSRNAAIQTAVLGAAEIPLRTATLCRDAIESLHGVCQRLNPNLATDVATGVSLLRSGAVGACFNVEVNLLDLRDPSQVERMTNSIEQIRARCDQLQQQVFEWVAKALS